MEPAPSDSQVGMPTVWTPRSHRTANLTINGTALGLTVSAASPILETKRVGVISPRFDIETKRPPTNPISPMARNGLGGIRTLDPRLKRALLYQLSYQTNTQKITKNFEGVM